ncbi:MAG: GNAT family N-acetyltransferase [Caulobacteraceae bacterium]|nr:GNAT family N-acetyltransferase [Caulobacteraceae bacterium]
MIQTDRLVLRAPTDADRPAIAAVNGEPEVGRWLGGVLDRAASDAMVDRILASIAEHGFGVWVAERRTDAVVVGLIGLQQITERSGLPMARGVEIDWRLAPAAWGCGYATEGAAAALDWGLTNLDEPEILAFTARINPRSQAVMRRIGMTPDPVRDFGHPRLAPGDPLHPHVVYRKAGPGTNGH